MSSSRFGSLSSHFRIKHFIICSSPT